MLHEVLLALSGHSGGLFKDTGDGIKVLSDVPFIHPSEVNQLNQLCRLGTFYRDFNAFIRKHGGTQVLHKDDGVQLEGLHGLYIKAFCHGLDQVLDKYRQDLRTLEQQILKDAHLPVSHMVTTLMEYHMLFPCLSHVIDQLISHKAHGCYVLDILHKNSICGLPVVKEALYKIMHVCHGVMYKQMCSWLLHGSLVDPYNEFFVQRSTQDGELTDQSQRQDDDDLGILGVTGRQLQKLMSLSTPDWSSRTPHQFCLKSEYLPVYIPIHVANRILFVGESIQMFEDESKPAAHKRGSILKNKEDEFAKDLHELSKQSQFNVREFEAMIDKIRTHVAEHLWKMVVEEADLLSHLKIIKDFYLLGRGELYQAFIDQAQSQLRVPPTGNTEHDVNMTYQQAARNVLFTDENLLQRFHLTVTLPAKPANQRHDSTSSTGSGSSQSGTIESGWNSLGLTYTVQWPLHIFFTPAVLEKYNRVFRFLLLVRRAQMDLQHCWMLQMQHKHGLSSPEESFQWQLRTHMSFLVDNLQYYLQVDVIESLYGMLEDKITATRDFEAVKLAHDQFLAGLLSQSFVHMKTVSHCLSEILEQCGAFSTLLTSCQSPMLARERERLENIAKNFQRQSSLLFKILSSVRSNSSSPHLAQLLLRLDFNKYFTIAGGQLGNY